jgi:hypothetical protein
MLQRLAFGLLMLLVAAPVAAQSGGTVTVLHLYKSELATDITIAESCNVARPGRRGRPAN